MDSALHLILLHLSVGMINGNDFRVTQPRSLEGFVGSSVDIPCSFTYPESFNPTKIDICWRRHGFHGRFIFNVSKPYTHPDYRGRIEFLGFPYRDRTGTIRINHLEQSDQNRYFCRVETTGDYSEKWQSLVGTELIVGARRPPSITTTTTPTPTTGSSARDTAGKNRNGSLSKPGLWIGCIVVGLLLSSVGLAICFWCKKRKKEEQQRGKIKQDGQTGVPGLSDNPPQNRDPRQTGSPDLPQAAGEGNGSEEIVYATLKVNGGPTAKYKAEPADNSVLLRGREVSS
ncbi:paired immunoglobulin-like type 2 receptor beta [Scyliorhinus torazame]|uniref:paired immunoglobulin-like type 2 receptor beta n=1 Tax=Scyliorhinus torazame TaxID=75743 RepID=UPI003B5AFD5E